MNGQANPNATRITPKQAEAYIPPLSEMIGNTNLRDYLTGCLNWPKPEEDANLLVTGPPGSGKTVALISYLRQRLDKPDIGYEDDVGFFATLEGRQYGFVRIDGGSVDEDRLKAQIKDATHNSSVHTFVLIDEAGELFFRKLEERVRPMLDHPRVTTFATAHNFHGSKRRTDTEREHEERLKALLRRFPVRIATEAPTATEMIQLIEQRLRAWGMRAENNTTLELLVRKSSSSDGYIPSYALGCLIQAIGLHKEVLTHRFVDLYEPDPLRL